MHQMAQSSVFLSGMGGLGIEIGRLNITSLHNSTRKHVMANFKLQNQLWVGAKFLFWFRSKECCSGGCEGKQSV